MLNHPQFDPVAFSLFGLPVRWYGLMYVLAFAAAIFLGRRHLRRGGAGGVTAPVFDEVLFYAILGVFIGGRLGYVLFYQFDDYIGRPFAAAIAAAFKDDGRVWAALADSFAVLKVWEGGMSFHGGLVGVIVGFWWVARRRGWSFLRITDFAAPLAAPGLGFGRIGNFINGELWGRQTDLPWGMVFAAGDAPRHPSQLYEFALEGIALFALLWAVSAKRRPVGWISGVFMVGYAAARFTAEFAREPDAHLGLLFGGMSMGQLLCLPMAAVGVFLLFRHRLTESAAEPTAKPLPRKASLPRREKPPQDAPRHRPSVTSPPQAAGTDEGIVTAATAPQKPAVHPKKRRKRKRPY